jgi:hypothetical protein
MPDPETPPVDNWLLSMPEELQNENLLQNFKTPEALARGYVETKKWADGRVKMPSEDASPEDLNQFYGRLGVPESPDKYEFTPVEAPAGFDPKAVDEFRPVFHGLKLTKAQADGVQKAYLEKMKVQQDALVANYNTEKNQKIEVLRGRWGDKYDSNLEIAQRFFADASPAVQAYIEQNGLGNHPDFIEFLYQKGTQTLEDTYRPGGDPMVTKTLDDQIKAVTAELIALPEGDPRRKDVLTKRDALFNQRYPNQRPA